MPLGLGRGAIRLLGSECPLSSRRAFGLTPKKLQYCTSLYCLLGSCRRCSTDAVTVGSNRTLCAPQAAVAPLTGAAPDSAIGHPSRATVLCRFGEGLLTLGDHAPRVDGEVNHCRWGLGRHGGHAQVFLALNGCGLRSYRRRHREPGQDCAVTGRLYHPQGPQGRHHPTGAAHGRRST
jgi:hypothetical protein